MTFPIFAPAIPPSPGTEIAPEVKVLAADFGDGYRQRAADGLNNIRDTFAFAWEALPAADADAIVAFLKARLGTEAFLYTPPGESAPRKFTCTKWARKRVRFSYHQITATFVEVFDL